jgi:hypothetical protein
VNQRIWAAVLFAGLLALGFTGQAEAGPWHFHYHHGCYAPPPPCYGPYYGGYTVHYYAPPPPPPPVYHYYHPPYPRSNVSFFFGF